MHDTPSRLAVALLLLAGLLTVGLSAGAAAGLPAQASDALLAAWHRQSGCRLSHRSSECAAKAAITGTPIGIAW